MARERRALKLIRDEPEGVPLCTVARPARLDPQVDGGSWSVGVSAGSQVPDSRPMSTLSDVLERDVVGRLDDLVIR
jgi:hypothetical protein